MPLVTSTPANLKLHDVVSTMLYKISWDTLEKFYDTESYYGFCILAMFRPPNTWPEKVAMIRRGDEALVTMIGMVLYSHADTLR